jgi:ABC-2 type transport system ATP-binding protein
MIDVNDLTKSYGPVEALRGVSFHVDAGEIIGLLGPNGAGKTTMMKILTGYLQPTGGTVTVDGLNVLTHALEIQKRIGYQPENAPLYPELSVQAYLKMIADLRQIPEADQTPLLIESVRATGLSDHLTRPIGQLSKGYRQRVGLAQAIVHQPKLLILDEPTIGLDPTQIVEVRHLIRRMAQRSTVLLSTHILSEVEAICNRVIILLNGEIKADAHLDELAATTDVILVLQEGADDVTADLKAVQGVSSVEFDPLPDGHTYRVRATDGLDLRPAIYTLARDKGWALKELRRDVRTLETVFNELATAPAEGPPDSAGAAEAGGKEA